MTDRDELFLNARIATFSERYRPKDQYEAQEFDVALHSIVRAIYAEAVRPFAYELNVHREHALLGMSKAITAA